MLKYKYKFSIISLSNNNQSTLEKMLISVSNQKFKNFEHIIQDNNSTDLTKKILNNYKNHKIKFFSEKDEGVYNGLNIAIKKAQGEIISILHSDDRYYDDNVLYEVNRFFNLKKCDATYGDLIYLNNNKVFRYWKSNQFKKKSLLYGWMPPHPTLFLRRETYHKMNYFDESYKISSDYDFMIRFFKNPSYKIFYIPKTLVYMNTGGISNKSIINIIKKTFEDYRVIKKNNLMGFVTLIFKNIRKLKQLFSK